MGVTDYLKNNPIEEHSTICEYDIENEKLSVDEPIPDTILALPEHSNSNISENCMITEEVSKEDLDKASVADRIMKMQQIITETCTTAPDKPSILTQSQEQFAT